MTWVTIIWSVGAGACLTLALMHFIVWCKDRTARANLAFAVLAIAVAAFAAFELAMMHADTPEQWGLAVRWLHVPLWIMVTSLVVFVRLYLRAGRRWLAWAIVGLRTVSLILNFASWPNINYREITSLRHIFFLGETVSVGKGVPNHWALVPQLSLVLLIIFVLDATLTAWRRGDRRQALIVGGSILFFVVAGTAQGSAMIWWNIPMPLTVSLFYQGMVTAMAYELSYDVLHAAALARRLHVSEAGLRESEERFRIVADAAPVLIWMAGMDKLCTFFNKPWLEFTGRTLEQELGNGWAEGVHPDDLEWCLTIYTESFDARQPFVMQYRLRRHDGEYRWLSDQGVPRFDAQGDFTGYIGSCIDVTEFINEEHALRESEERMSLAADAAKLGMWEWNSSTDEVWTSKTRRDFLGLPISGKVTFEDFISRVHIDDRDRVQKTLNGAIENGRDYESEFRVVLPDGYVRWMAARGRCLTDAAGKRIGLRGVSMDVTERKQAEEKFRLAVEASPNGIVLVDKDGRIVLVNTHVEELFGYQREELIGKVVDVLVPERFRTNHPMHRARYFAKPEAVVIGAGRELFGRRKDGGEFPVEIGLNPIETEDGILVLAAVADITARKQAELEALRHREEIGHLSRVAAMGQLAASIAHELNQPLSGITSNASAGQRFIDRGDVDLRELRELLGDIIADGHRAGDVIRGLQSMVKKEVRARQRLNLNNLVGTVVQMVKPDAMLRSCELNTVLEAELPSIEGDPIQLQQVLLNLVINAFDAMRDTPTSHRKVAIATQRNAHGSIRVSVRDYGIGIPEEARERVFEQFFTTKAKGLGMGLTIVRSIVESHGGTIAVENPDGGGARFDFTLPVNAAGSSV
jgi:PAS domain S-box-containing protein